VQLIDRFEREVLRMEKRRNTSSSDVGAEEDE
jgi:hypothetical protein